MDAFEARVGVLTVSDLGSQGQRVDTAGPSVAALVQEAGATVVESAIVADEREAIAGVLRRWADEAGVQIILTTGGTGLAPRDVTPEATLDVADRLVPGFAEVMRASSREKTPLADMSRAVVAIRGRTLIVNLPGSERGARENLQSVIGLFSHVMQQLWGDAKH